MTEIVLEVLAIVWIICSLGNLLTLFQIRQSGEYLAESHIEIIAVPALCIILGPILLYYVLLRDINR